MKNLWLKILISYLLIHHFLVPPFVFDDYKDTLLADLWQYKPLSLVFIYYLLFTSIQQMRWTEHRLNLVAKTMMWTGLIAAIYIVLQYFNLDEKQSLMGVYKTQAPRVPSDRLASTLTHPNYAGVFIAMCLPFAVGGRRWVKAGVMTAAVVLTTSWSAIAAMVGGLCFYGWHQIKQHFDQTIIQIGFYFLIMPTFILILAGYGHLPSDSGRFYTWSLMFDDWTQRPIFGYGLGSFSILFQSRHESVFTHAHNEFFQLIYETGIVGGLLFLTLVVDFFKHTVHLLKHDVQKNKQEISLAFYSSFVTILLGSLGLFVWQLEPTRFFTVVLCGILAANTTTKGEKDHEEEYFYPKHYATQSGWTSLCGSLSG